MNESQHRDIKQIITLLNSDTLVSDKKTDECVSNVASFYKHVFVWFYFSHKLLFLISYCFKYEISLVLVLKVLNYFFSSII